MRKLLLLFIILTACSDRATIKSKNGIDFLDPVTLELDKLDEKVWTVGKKRDAEVSMGVNLKVSVPQIDDDGVSYLQRKYGIDTWVYKLTKLTRGSRSPIGFFQYNLHSISGVNDYVNINIYYHAASVSSDFRRFHCPAFDHRYRLAEFGLTESKEPKRNQIYVRRKEVLNARIEKVSFAPMIFSAGKSLTGNYKIEVALFNSNEKRIYSQWFSAQNSFIASREVQVDVPSCRGIKEENNPLPSSRAPRLEDLRIPK